MAFTREKEKAFELRRSGESISQIALKLGMNKSTVSIWCRDIILSTSQIKTLDRRQIERGMIGSLRAAEIKRANRIRSSKIENDRGANDVGEITKRDLFVLGVGLYWGEGYKSSNGEFGFTNSNPDIIKTFIKWVKESYKIQPRDFILRVSINTSYHSQAQEAVKYWSRVTQLPMRQFTKTSLIKTSLKKQYGNKRAYFGTLRVKVRRATALQRRVLGSLEYIAQAIVEK